MYSLPPRPLHKSATLVFPIIHTVYHTHTFLLSFQSWSSGSFWSSISNSSTQTEKVLIPPSSPFLSLSLSRCIARLTSSRPLHSSQISSPSHHHSSTNLTQSSKFFPILTTFPSPSYSNPSFYPFRSFSSILLLYFSFRKYFPSIWMKLQISPDVSCSFIFLFSFFRCFRYLYINVSLETEHASEYFLSFFYIDC